MAADAAPAPAPAGSWTNPLSPPAAPIYQARVLQGQQAGVVLNMVDFCTGQLFDWFLAEDTAFPLIERLPSNVTGNTGNPNCPGATHVGRELMYTQIIKELPVKPGVPHTMQIRYTRKADDTVVDSILDGKRVAASACTTRSPRSRSGTGCSACSTPSPISIPRRRS